MMMAVTLSVDRFRVRPLRIAQSLDLRILLWPTALWPFRYPGAEPQLGELLDLAATGYLLIYSERAGKAP